MRRCASQAGPCCRPPFFRFEKEMGWDGMGWSWLGLGDGLRSCAVVGPGVVVVG